MPKISNESVIAKFSEQHALYTLVENPDNINSVLLLAKLFLSPNHTFVLIHTLNESLEKLEHRYFQLLTKISEAVIEVRKLQGSSTLSTSEEQICQIKSSTKHELAHYRAALELLPKYRKNKIPNYEGKLVATLGAMIQLVGSESMVTVLPGCLVDFSDELSLDERLYAMATIVTAPFEIGYNWSELSQCDRNQLKQIKSQLSNATPLANTFAYHIAELLDQGLFDYNTKMINNE